MKQTMRSILYGIKDELTSMRNKMDNYMYGGEKPLQEEDLSYCRAVYDSICKTLDLL